MTQLNIRVRDFFSSVLLVTAALAFLAVTFVSRNAFAQASGGAVLTGTVTDSSTKQPVADVVVTATSPELQGEQVVVTDNTGFFRIPSLPSGTYSIKYEKDEYKPYDRTGIQLRADSTLRANAELLPTTLKAEEVVVVAKAPTVDVGSSSTGANISQDFTRRVPVAAPGGKGSGSRSFEAVAEVTPGANTDTYGTSISGASSAENGYVVDGLSVSNPGNGTIGTGLSTEFVKEVNVVSGGYMPEFGRTTGGVLNAVTKSGSNEFHGSIFSYYTPGKLAATPKIAVQTVDTVVGNAPLSYIGDIGFDIGGPIQKDKLWFYAGVDFNKTSYDIQRSFYRQVDPGRSFATQKIGGADQSVEAVSQQIQAIAKLTYAIDQNNKLTASFIVAPTWAGGEGKFGINPLTGDPESEVNGTFGSLAHRLTSTAYDANLKWSTEFDNKRVLVDTMVGWHHQQDNILASDGTGPGSKTGLASIPNVQWNRAQGDGNDFHGLPEFERGFDNGACAVTNPPRGSGITTACPLTTYQSGGPGGPLNEQTFNRYVVGSTVTYLFQGAGHHVAKAGFSLEYTQWDHIKAHAGGTNIIEGADGTLSDGEHFGVLAGPDNPRFLEPFRLSTKSIIAGGFVQDSWSVMDLFTLNVGIRYDIQALYGSSGQLGLVMPNEWSPRIGAIYDPTQEGRSKFFVNYARYYENVPLSLADGSLSGEPSVIATYKNCTPNDTLTSPYCQQNSQRAVANSPASPSQKWGSFGAGATPLDPEIKPTSSDEIVLGGEYELFKDSRIGASYQKRWLNHWIEDMSRDNRQTFFLGNPGEGIATDFPKAERNYDALTLYFNKTFGEDWLTQASYTISYLRGNIGGLFGSNGELNPNRLAAFDSKLFTVNSYGPLPGDHTHSVKIFTAKDWTITKEHGLTTGLAFRAASGGPLNFLGADELYGEDIYLLLPRGSAGRTPWTYDVDMNIGYRYSIDRDKSIAVGVDIFNLLNLAAITNRSETYTRANAVGKQDGKLTDVTVFTENGPRPINQGDKDVNFLNVGDYQQPRIFRFNIRGTF